ncbi:MAG: sulfatase-like hydrolase/transferase [Opitutaceae bacterium]|nr:sulfatase-like hydrolase/transferase [Opitutaceae bacterium]
MRRLYRKERPPGWLLHLVFLFGVSGGWVSAAPNILVLFADDYCHEVLHAMGDPVVQTPNLDRLVARGTVFTHAYNMGSWAPAVCIASRTMLMTGRSLWDARRIYSRLESEREAGQLWPQLLGAAGYRTFMSGKWHLPVDAARAFSDVAHIRPGMPKDVPQGYLRPVQGHIDPWDPTDRNLGGYWEGGKHWSEVTADDVVDYLARTGTDQRPFFVYCAFNAPHDPRQAPREYLERYGVEQMTLPVNFLPAYPYAKVMEAGPDLRDERLAPYPRTEFAVRTHRREYYALISHLDAQIGRVLDALEASGRSADTWVFFTADHGLAVGQHGLMGKQNMHEHSLRVPFIVAGPGVAANRRIETRIYLQDVMPTTLELAGVSRPSQVWYRSVLPLMGESGPGEQPDIYSAYRESQRALIHDSFKLIVYPAGKVLRLYQLDKDPAETTDLAMDEAYVSKTRELFALLLQQQRLLGDPIALQAAFPEWSNDGKN